MNDILIVLLITIFGGFCAGIGSLMTQIVMGNKIDELKRNVISRVAGAYGHTSGPAKLVQELLEE